MSHWYLIEPIYLSRKELPDLTYLHKVVVELGTAGLTEGPDALDRTHIQLSLFTNSQIQHITMRGASSVHL